MSLEFIAGAGLSLLFHAGRLRLRYPAAWIALGFAAMAAGFPLYAGVADQARAGDWARCLVFGAPACLILAAAVSAGTGGRRPPGWLRRTGDASYSTYLSHVLVLSALGRLWSLRAGPGAWDNVLALPALFLAALAAGWASYRWLETPLLAWFRKRLPGGSPAFRMRSR
jgi:peptidoglycan/LPS O-acetylase OafA/YrhL